MTNLDKVREALEFYENTDSYYQGDSGAAVSRDCGQKALDALSALSAHEEEVRELVEALKVALPAIAVAGLPEDLARARAALDKVKE